MSTKRDKRRFADQVASVEPAVSQRQPRVKPVIFSPRNAIQKDYVRELYNDRTSILFAIGPAGTGKTMLAVLMGIKLFQEGKIDKIVVTRPAVSVDEDHGFLPGDLNEKMAPWTRPIFDVFAEYFPKRVIDNMLYEGQIEISPLAYMRGRTFKNSFIIADECQGCTPNQMKMLLTRLGEGSRMVITGDLAQADRGNDNGLFDFMSLYDRADDSEFIKTIEFDHKCIERHPAVSAVLKIYGDH